MTSWKHRFVGLVFVAAGCGSSSQEGMDAPAVDARVIDAPGPDGAGTCSTAAQCPSGGPCQVAKCNNGSCELVAAPASEPPTLLQVPGDCQKQVCDGTSQEPVSVNDDNDLPPDVGSACSIAACTLGTPSQVFAPTGTACTDSGGQLCDGVGQCVACVTSEDCPAPSVCQIPRCETSGTCAFDAAVQGTFVQNTTLGDCKTDQCDGMGNITTDAPDDADVHDDNNQCTADLCMAGMPSHAALPVGTACDQDGGSMCDGAGACVVAPTFVRRRAAR